MIVSHDGYAIVHYRNRNQIVITMPQTAQTLTNTIGIVRNRKIDLTDADLAILLELTRYLCERGEEACPASKPEYLQREQPKPKTRADQIRAMSDKKLASYLNKVETDGRVYGPQGQAYWLNWLRQEVEE